MRRAAVAAACALLACAPVFTGAQAQQREMISFESRPKGQPVQVTAEITWPANAGAGPVPAMVIHHGVAASAHARPATTASWCR